MIEKTKIERINELANKAKSPEGLTLTEAAERAALRREYIDAVKDSLRPQLESIRYVDEDGAVTNPRTGEIEGYVAPEDENDDPRHGA